MLEGDDTFTRVDPLDAETDHLHDVLTIVEVALEQLRLIDERQNILSITERDARATISDALFRYLMPPTFVGLSRRRDRVLKIAACLNAMFAKAEPEA